MVKTILLLTVLFYLNASGGTHGGGVLNKPGEGAKANFGSAIEEYVKFIEMDRNEFVFEMKWKNEQGKDVSEVFRRRPEELPKDLEDLLTRKPRKP